MARARAAVLKRKLARQIYTRLSPAEDLLLADLGSKALRDTGKDQYPLTRLRAEAIHAQHPDVQGLCRTSRGDDAANALVLFGDRTRAASGNYRFRRA